MRLPNKPLVDIVGMPMVVRVARRAALAQVDEVIVAVDDVQVQEVVAEAGFDVEMTSKDHISGSDRVMEVAARRAWSNQDIVINVQGDEPLLPPSVINQIAQYMKHDPHVAIATLSEPIESAADFVNPNVVKVVSDRSGRALYFSRASIPFPRDDVLEEALTDAVVQQAHAQRHVGVYGFQVHALKHFVTLSDSRLERIERLEQLRWLEDGGRIDVLQSAVPIPGGVDTQEDLDKVRQIIAVNAL